MRAVFALSLSIALCASANAATPHRSKSHLRARQPVIVHPGQSVTPPKGFAVPGWSDDQTRRWLDNASSSWTKA